MSEKPCWNTEFVKLAMEWEGREYKREYVGTWVPEPTVVYHWHDYRESFVWAPYVPVIRRSQLSVPPRFGKMALMTRYAEKVVNKDYYGTVQISDGEIPVKSFTVPHRGKLRCKWTAEVAEVVDGTPRSTYDSLVREMTDRLAEEIDERLSQRLFDALDERQDPAIIGTLEISEEEVRRRVEKIVQFDKIEPPRIKSIVAGTVQELWKPVDFSRFPHLCPRCSAPAYIGFTSVECSREGCG